MQQYDHYPVPGGYRIAAPKSPLDGSMWESASDAATAIDAEQTKIKAAVDADLAEGGPLMQGLTLFAAQLMQLDWDDLDLQIDLSQRIVIFPGDEMLAISEAHRFFDDLIAAQVAAPSECYLEYLAPFQDSLFAVTAS
jgi:hypothetical protein